MDDHRITGGSSSSPFYAENDLEAALIEAARDPARRPAFLELLLRETVFALGTAAEATRLDPSKAGGTDVQLYGIFVEGRRVIPAFTSTTRIGDYVASPQPYFGLRGADLLGLLEPDVGLVLNPASAYGKEFLPQEILRLRRLRSRIRGPAAI